MSRCPACGCEVIADAVNQHAAPTRQPLAAGDRMTLRMQVEQAARYHLRMSDVDPTLVLALLDATEPG